MKKIVLSGLVLASFLLVGCAYNKQTVALRPTVSALATMRVRDVAVEVKVVDERESKSLGKRSDAYGMGAEITTTDDVAGIVAREVAAALKQYGFAVDAGDGNGAQLKVEVRLLNYDTSTGFFTGGVHIRAALKATARQGTAVYEKFYRSEEEHRVMVVPTAETNAEWLNAGLSDAIDQLVNDTALLEFLSKP